MGLLSELLGNASTIDPEGLADELGPILAAEETVEVAFRVIRDQLVFTSKRLMLIDKQGMTGKKVEYLSIPYKAITRFSVETAGHFDLDAELKVWVSGSGEPISKTLGAVRTTSPRSRRRWRQRFWRRSKSTAVQRRRLAVGSS